MFCTKIYNSNKKLLLTGTPYTKKFITYIFCLKLNGRQSDQNNISIPLFTFFGRSCIPIGISQKGTSNYNKK